MKDTPQSNTDWREKFVNRLTYINDIHGDTDDVYNRTFHGTINDVSQVLNFISQLLEAEKKRWKSEVESTKLDLSKGSNSFGSGWNEALDAVLQKLS